jgi:SNF2 family DNA or RNA helicase
MVRHTKEQVAPELPKHIIVPTHVEMDSRQESLYKQVQDSIDLEVVSDQLDSPMIIQNLLVQLVRLQQISTDPKLVGSNVNSGKMEWLFDFLAEHKNDKVLIFTRWRDTALRLHSVLNGALIVGGEPARNVKEFQYENVNVLVGTIASMGVGFNFPMAQYAVFLDMEWSSLLMQQAYDRIHRMNITEVKVSYILLSSKIDRHIYKSVMHKWSEREAILEYIHGG